MTIKNKPKIMNNPWKQISNENKILNIDKDIIIEHNERYAENEYRKISTMDYPEPFLGNPKARIYILLANPGRDISSEETTLKLVIDNNLDELILKNLNHDHSGVEYPFYFLDPRFAEHPGGKWWKKTFKNLIGKSNEIDNIKETQKAIANEFFGVELYGYHSPRCEKSFVYTKNKQLPSSKYSHKLIKTAIKENKIILLARAVGDWFKMVPELKDYDNCFFVASNRGIDLSNRTISPRAYKEIKEIILNKINVK